jgi:hypothetical protein
MRNIFLSMILIMFSALVNAEIKPFVGLTINSFGVSTEDASISDGSGFNDTLDKSNDGGIALGFSGGLIMSDNSKINIAYFSGEDKDTEVFDVTTVSLSYDHSFNNKGVHRGWFIGGGIASVEIEVDALLVLGSAGFASAKDKTTGVLLRGGYEYLYDNNIALEFGVNAYAFDVDIKTNGIGSYLGVDFSVLDIEMPASLSSFYLQMNYVF